jgi:alpha-tubulin suppressor-like RCC1 family protein
LGLGNVTYYSTPKQIGALTTWLKVAAGYYQSAAIKTDGTLWAWGRNSYGQLGVGDTTNRSSPVQIGALTTWSIITSGKEHFAAIKTDGTMWSWGGSYSNYGQLGLGNTTSVSSPTQIGALSTWSNVSAGQDKHCLAIKTDGTLWTWGRNYHGQLGQGTTTDRSSPVQVGALTTWLRIAGGRYHSMAIKTDGAMWAWGHNQYGQLGQGDTSHRSSPVQIGALTTWSKIAGGGFFCTAIG